MNDLFAYRILHSNSLCVAAFNEILLIGGLSE